MLLASVEELRDRNAKDDTVVNNNAILAALETASRVLESEVRSTLASETGVVDLFHVKASATIATSLQVKLRTSRGFLKSTPAVAIKAAQRSQWFSTGDGEVLDVRAINGVDYATINHERGVILINGVDVSDRWVQVTYDCGFSATGTPAVYTGTPDWLVQAGELLASIEMEGNPVFRDEDESEYKATELRRQLQSIVELHTRYEPTALRPVV